VAGILRKEQEMWQSTGKSMQEAFQDLNALFRKFIARRWCLVLTVVIELCDNGLVFIIAYEQCVHA